MPSDPPPELLEQRPALEGEHVEHPLMGLPLGRPPKKYTQAVHDRLVDELAKGQTVKGACARAGITVSTFHDWVARGKAGDPWLHGFAEDVEIAYNAAEASMVDRLQAFMDDEKSSVGLDATKFALERMRPDGFSKQVKSLVDKQIEQFLVRLEKALEPHIFEKVLAVYLGQAVVAPEQLGATKAPELEAHVEESE